MEHLQRQSWEPRQPITDVEIRQEQDRAETILDKIQDPGQAQGETVEYTGGCRRSRDVEDLRFSLLPTQALRRWAQRMAMGEAKHGSNNWRGGMPWSHCVDHLMEHLLKWLDGDTSEDHLAAVMCNAGFLMAYEEIAQGWCDVPARDRPTVAEEPRGDAVEVEEQVGVVWPQAQVDIEALEAAGFRRQVIDGRTFLVGPRQALPPGIPRSHPAVKPLS